MTFLFFFSFPFFWQLNCADFVLRVMLDAVDKCLSRELPNDRATSKPHIRVMAYDDARLSRE